MKKFTARLQGVDWASVLCAVGCIGTVVTGILAGLGGAKTKDNWDPEGTKKEKALVILKHEWPAILCCGATIACDILARRIDKKTIAELVKLGGVCGAVAGQFADYRQEVADEFGIEAENRIRERVNQKWYEEGVGEELDELTHTFYEPVTRKFFDCPTSVIFSTIESLNFKLNQNPYYRGLICMDDFFASIGHSELIDSDVRKAGWYGPLIFPTGGMTLIHATFDLKIDPIGKNYWIINWDRNCNPFEDVKLEMWKEGVDYEGK